jgi:hypothetical protein
VFVSTVWFEQDCGVVFSELHQVMLVEAGADRRGPTHRAARDVTDDVNQPA